MFVFDEDSLNIKDLFEKYSYNVDKNVEGVLLSQESIDRVFNHASKYIELKNKNNFDLMKYKYVPTEEIMNYINNMKENTTMLEDGSVYTETIGI